MTNVLRTTRLMGVQVQSMGDSMQYLGSEIPVYAIRDGISRLMERCIGFLR